MRTRVAALVGIVAALTPATALAVPDTPSRAKHRCRAGRVPVTIVGHRRCAKPRAALPRPRSGDQRLLLFQYALDTNLGPVRDRRGRRAPTMKKLFRRLGPRAYGFMRRKLPAALARVDRELAGGAGARSAGAGLNCRNIPRGGWRGFSESGPNGLKLEVRTNGNDLEAVVEGRKDGQLFRIEFDLDGCTLTETRPLPGCPTATGELHAAIKLRAGIKVSVIEDGEVAQRVTIHLDGTTKIDAQVGDDAKLDHMTIDDLQKSDEYVPALITGIFGPMSVHTKAHRTARVNLRTGAYEPGQSNVEVDAHLGGLVGVFLGGRFREGAANRMKQETERMFAATVQDAIDRLRSREEAWQEAGKCADLKFSPASGTLTLADGASGDFTGQVVDKGGDASTAGRWRRTGQENATVTPDTATGGNPSFHYTVTRAGSGLKVKASFQATSQAGVAGGDWTQDTEGEILYLGHVSGSLTWDNHPCPDLTHHQFSYSADLEQAPHTGGPPIPFAIYDEAIMSHPGAGIAGWGTGESGAGSWSSGPCDQATSLWPDCPSSPLTPAPGQGHGSVIFSREGDMIKATARSFSWESHASVDCDMSWGTPDYAVGTFPVGDVGEADIEVPLKYDIHGTEDGITTDYVGSGTLKLHRVK